MPENALIIEQQQRTTLDDALPASLEKISLRHNQMASLPDAIWRLPRLRYLSLSNNQFTTLPAQIGQLHALTHLFLDHNPLAQLPPEIGQLAQLHTLDIAQALL